MRDAYLQLGDAYLPGYHLNISVYVSHLENIPEKSPC